MRTFALAAIAAALAVCTACGAAADADRQPPPGPRPATPEGAALEARLAVERPELVPSGRNPFRFGPATAAAARAARGPLPPPDGLPELPLPIVTPPLKLLGIATLADGARVAVLRVGADLVLAREGETVGNRFRVGRVADTAVELTDAVGERLVRLDLP